MWSLEEVCCTKDLFTIFDCLSRLSVWFNHLQMLTTKTIFPTQLWPFWAEVWGNYSRLEVFLRCKELIYRFLMGAVELELRSHMIFILNYFANISVAEPLSLWGISSIGNMLSTLSGNSQEKLLLLSSSRMLLVCASLPAWPQPSEFFSGHWSCNSPELMFKFW